MRTSTLLLLFVMALLALTPGHARADSWHGHHLTADEARSVRALRHSFHPLGRRAVRLVLHISWRESRFQRHAVNGRSGAHGLLQQLPAWDTVCGFGWAAAVQARAGRCILAAQGWSAWAL